MSWPLVKLGDVATLINGRAYKKTELLDSGPTPVLRVGNFFSNRSWYYSDLTLPEDKYCNEGDLLFAWSASFGPKIWDGPRAIYHYHIWKIVVSPAIDKNYLYHLLGSISAEIKSQGNGITMVHATKGGMEKREIPLPSLPEQQKIAAILDAADQLRQKDQQLIEHYARLGQALFLEMFGDPVGNPMGWDSFRLENMLEFLTSGSRGWAKYYAESGDLFLRIQNVGKNSLILNDVAHVIAPDNAEAKRTTVQPGDILLSITADLGRTAVIPENIGKAHINQHLAILRLKKEFNPNYVSEYIASVGGKRQLDTMDKGGVKAGLNFSDIKSLIILNPPIAMQEQYLERTQQIEQQKQSAQVSLEKSESLFNSLLQRAFKGELTR